MHYSIMTTAMTLRRFRCAFCMSFISPFRSSFRPYNRAYAYRGLTAFAPLSMEVSDGNLSNAREVTMLFETIDHKLSCLSVLVNNAVILREQSRFEDISEGSSPDRVGRFHLTAPSG
ncbi:MAG: hypothetical protein KZQ60_06780 [Candidatus Thiodiazotropha sp. (ex Lucinoma aequizonata)]|nr:hypothetical protein [Candidatus Thiodiazotropha sp. (ex Lucinoma aequizonata)]